jgi:hypothetical protein
MPKGVLLAISAPSDPSREAEFEEWYEHTHMAEVLAIPGVVGGRRLRLSDVQLVPGSTLDEDRRYLVIYDIEADDLREVRRAIARTRFEMSDAIQLKPPPRAVFYEQLA